MVWYGMVWYGIVGEHVISFFSNLQDSDAPKKEGDVSLDIVSFLFTFKYALNVYLHSKCNLHHILCRYQKQSCKLNRYLVLRSVYNNSGTELIGQFHSRHGNDGRIIFIGSFITDSNR